MHGWSGLLKNRKKEPLSFTVAATYRVHIAMLILALTTLAGIILKKGSKLRFRVILTVWSATG